MFLSCFFAGTISFAAPWKPFQFNGKSIAPGQKLAVLLPVTDGRDTAVVPVTVFHGRKPGPVLGIIAGVHGYEYPPILAAQQLARELDPAQLSGTIILVHIANVAGFLGRSVNVNPQDNKNLNRVFPGQATGTVTERLAWLLSHDIIGRCHYVVDVHAGDAPEDLRPYAGYYNYFDTPELSEKGRQMAVAMGFPYVIQFGNEPTLKAASVYCSREAIKRGIPAADIECGRLGMPESENVALIRQALHRLLMHLRIEEGTLPASPAPYLVTRRVSIDSQHTGFFFPKVKAGEFVYQGQALGHITDLFGSHLTDVTATANGVVLVMTGTPPINKGDNLFTIGEAPARQ
ncbi:M14 family metallopeptidase [Hymenobacter endophyticus]|uniref:M14 family metallopeptidase n=1 Tax=Hymenobacter endophyticus TaxID=3076335 RepID=A0ABU3TEW8_9BACT|nr:M14 family metallopeptidase [Hymenobacter endophyticus]MDU0369922.1 M14 family metallopeptidase [Hymenobacter endophyticus]